jgi:predicted RNase H-like nuclease
MAVMGVDGDRRGWVGVVLEGGEFVAAALAPTLDELTSGFGSLEAVAVDMPIGWCEGE